MVELAGDPRLVEELGDGAGIPAEVGQQALEDRQALTVTAGIARDKDLTHSADGDATQDAVPVEYVEGQPPPRRVALVNRSQCIPRDTAALAGC